jgi:acyl carrier protein
MSDGTVMERLRGILREVRRQAPHHALEADVNLVDTLGLDSLDVANFVTEVECAFRVALPLDALRQHNTLTSLSTLIRSAMPAGAVE